MTRRDLLTASVLGISTSCSHSTAPRPRISIHRAPAYDNSLYSRVLDIFQQHRLSLKGKRVVLKPNLVEFDSATAINTHPLLVHAVYEAVKKAGASQVTIAEGPGHRRGTLDLADAAGYFATVPAFESTFTDLNLDRVSKIKIAHPTSRLKELYLPHTALNADLLISLPKLKTHHWVGATLSMKNLFGLVPGAVYGWPKNVLHWAGIPECITDINSLFPRTFAIVDGIVGMEGNGPIQGFPKHAGVLVAGSNLPAVDATCCRIMRMDPARIEYLHGLPIDKTHIQQIGESIDASATPFELIPEFKSFRA